MVYVKSFSQDLDYIIQFNSIYLYSAKSKKQFPRGAFITEKQRN